MLEIVDQEGEQVSLPADSFTPLPVELPPGRYTVRISRPEIETVETCVRGRRIWRAPFAASSRSLRWRSRISSSRQDGGNDSCLYPLGDPRRSCSPSFC